MLLISEEGETLNIDDLKKKYNDLLIRNNKAEVFFATGEVKKKHILELYKITIGLSNLRTNIEKLSEKEMTKEEILNGFKEVSDFC